MNTKLLKIIRSYKEDYKNFKSINITLDSGVKISLFSWQEMKDNDERLTKVYTGFTLLKGDNSVLINKSYDQGTYLGYRRQLYFSYNEIILCIIDWLKFKKIICK